jgi:hypothetical protein
MTVECQLQLQLQLHLHRLLEPGRPLPIQMAAMRQGASSAPIAGRNSSSVMPIVPLECFLYELFMYYPFIS